MDEVDGRRREVARLLLFAHSLRLFDIFLIFALFSLMGRSSVVLFVVTDLLFLHFIIFLLGMSENGFSVWLCRFTESDPVASRLLLSSFETPGKKFRLLFIQISHSSVSVNERMNRHLFPLPVTAAAADVSPFVPTDNASEHTPKSLFCHLH